MKENEISLFAPSVVPDVEEKTSVEGIGDDVVVSVVVSHPEPSPP